MRGRRLVALLAIGMALHPAAAAACSCAPRSPSEALREADAAIVGRLVKVVPHGQLQAVYRYRVQRAYKAGDAIAAGQMLSVRSARRAAACALPRRVGHRYGLFLLRRDEWWTGGICGVVSPLRMRRAAQRVATSSARASVQPLLCG